MEAQEFTSTAILCKYSRLRVLSQRNYRQFFVFASMLFLYTQEAISEAYYAYKSPTSGVDKLTWLVMGGHPAARSRTAEQFT
ncbi:MAG: hypothetical protein VXW65_02670, partial [Pseudomonadota bacterium]|nr:hypothetical protein [Pseudomonadota bacterium]